MTWLTDPLSFDFIQQAMLTTAMIAAAAAVLSCFLVLKGWSLMGDAIAHAILPGVVLAYIAGLPLILGAFAAGMTCAAATGFLTENSRIKQDTVMGVVFAGMFGLGIVLYTGIETELHLDHILFGDMLGLGWADVAEAGAIASAALAVTLVLRRDLMLFAFDPGHARAAGLPTGFLHYGLLAVIALVVVGALNALGLILAIALLIGPGAIAHLLTERFDHMLAVAVGVAVLATVTGILASFWIDSAPAPTIVTVMTGLFVLVFLFAPRHGILRRRVAPAMEGD
ncbi:MAG: metal ABC transporter permease [Pseudomonadota bacterium]